METARVDIRKLQLLNDRINQSIDALNQVRLSVHGLSHTAGFPNLTNNPMTGFSPGIGQQTPGFLPQQPMGFQQLPQGVPQPFAGGLSHTPFFQGGQGGWNPYAIQGGLNPYLPQAGLPAFGAFQNAGWGPYAAGVQGAWNPYGAGQFGGLSHTSGAEAMETLNRSALNDPLLAIKVAQTFPYAQYPVPPVVTLF